MKTKIEVNRITVDGHTYLNPVELRDGMEALYGEQMFYDWMSEYYDTLAELDWMDKSGGMIP